MMNMTGPGSLQAAAAASFFKGQDADVDSTKAREDRRKAYLSYITKKSKQNAEKASEPESTKGFMA